MARARHFFLLLLSLLSLLCQAQSSLYEGREKGGTDGGIVGKTVRVVQQLKHIRASALGG